MKMRAGLSFGIALLSGVAQPSYADISGRIVFENVEHSYFLKLPQDVGKPVPLVVALHGYGDTIKQFRDMTQLEMGAEHAQAALLFPQAAPDQEGKPAWTVGDVTAGKNDLEFVLAAIEDVQARYNTDAERVFLVGYSNGASLVYALACADAERFAGVAAVAGYISASDWQTCAPNSALPVLHVHAQDDDVVPFAGDMTQGVPGVLSLTQRWADWNNAQRFERGTSYSNASLTRYYDSDARLVVELAELAEAGHDWPIGFGDRYYASDEIWRFFQRVAPWPAR